MKRFFKVLPLAAVLITLTIASGFTQTAREIVDKADSAFTGERVYSESTMTIYRNGRTQPVQEMEGYSMEINGKYNSLSIYRAPARMKGTAYLMIEDDLWVRFSTTGRVRKMSSSAKKNSAGGSDLSYADMGDGNQGIADKYNVKLSGSAELDKTACHVIELTPAAEEALPYEKLLAYISKDDFRYLKIEYFEAGAKIKTMTLGDYREIGSRFYPFYIEMKSFVKDSRTVIETTMMELDSTRVQKRLFSTAYLENLR